MEQEAGKAPFLMQCYQADGVGPAPEVASGIMQPLDDLDGGGAKAWRSHTSKGEGIHIVVSVGRCRECRGRTPCRRTP